MQAAAPTGKEGPWSGPQREAFYKRLCGTSLNQHAVHLFNYSPHDAMVAVGGREAELIKVEAGGNVAVAIDGGGVGGNMTLEWAYRDSEKARYPLSGQETHLPVFLPPGAKEGRVTIWKAGDPTCGWVCNGSMQRGYWSRINGEPVVVL